MSVANVAGRGGKRSLGRALADQFRLPVGLVGRLAGWWMNRENARMNRLAVTLLAAGANDSVLELGFGPGQAIEMLVEQTAAPRIVGIDPSAVMLEQARERNRAAIESGRVRLLQAAVEELPLGDHEFSKVFAVSNFHDWQSRSHGLRQIRRVLQPGGMLLICLRRAPRRPGWFTKPGVTPDELTADTALLKAEGFRDVRIVERRVGQGLICLTARA